MATLKKYAMSGLKLALVLVCFFPVSEGLRSIVPRLAIKLSQLPAFAGLARVEGLNRIECAHVIALCLSAQLFSLTQLPLLRKED